MYRLPCLVMAPSVCLPPLEFCLGVRPSQAAKSRPDLNTLGSGTLAAITEAMSFPMPEPCPATGSSHFAHGRWRFASPDRRSLCRAPYMGSFVSRETHFRIGQTPRAVSVSEVRAHCMTRGPFPSTINLTYGRRSRRLHQHPACGGRGSGGRNHSQDRRFGPWARSVRPPGSARTDQVLEDLKIRSASIVRRLSSRLLR